MAEVFVNKNETKSSVLKGTVAIAGKFKHYEGMVKSMTFPEGEVVRIRRAKLKKVLCIIAGVLAATSLIACSNITGIADIINKTAKTATTGKTGETEVEDEQPAELTAEDLKVVDEINAESNLFCEFYGEVDSKEEPYFIETPGASNAAAVIIPKDHGTLRVKEIDILDAEYDLYGMTIGTDLADFEKEITKRGFEAYQQLDSLRHKSFKNGNIYVSINYDDNVKVNRIFMNALVDYHEWRPIE